MEGHGGTCDAGGEIEVYSLSHAASSCGVSGRACIATMPCHSIPSLRTSALKEAPKLPAVTETSCLPHRDP
jgi:hypothetical protein